MPRITPSEHGSTGFEKLLGHNPDILRSWNHVEKTIAENGHLSRDLKEQVRRVLAFGNGCQYCQAWGHAADTHPDPKESLAVGFAEMMLQGPQLITDQQFEVLKEEFDDAEISELLAWITFITASQTIGAVLQLRPDPTLPDIH
ncbi:carboxymuconolactone decarboxylase family protein [Nocardia sp. CA-107356]|uniref:carboxymuconolactone decarboxylase family protein n=1 Tax=Nocardia sp. CA-107356 TaxID=3239972 RepID=UPI003D8CAC7B